MTTTDTGPQPDPTPVAATDDFEEMLAGFDRIIHDKELQQQLIDAGLLVRTADPTPVAGEPPTPVKHIVKEGARYHVLSWHGGIREGRWTSWRTCSEPYCEVNREERHG